MGLSKKEDRHESDIKIWVMDIGMTVKVSVRHRFLKVFGGFYYLKPTFFGV